MYTYAVEVSPEIAEIRDQCIMEEIAKAKMSIEGMCKNLSEAKPEEVDIVEATKALRLLEERISVLTYIKNPPFKEGDQTKLVFPVKGSVRTMQIDIDKLKSAVTIQTEEEAEEEEKKENQYKEVDASNEENEFLE